MSTSATNLTSSIAALLDRQVDDQSRLTTLRAKVAVSQTETNVQAQLLGPLAPNVSSLLDIQA